MIRDMRLLAEFSVVAETCSFTLAATKLGVAQPWLSAQIKKLEDQLGVKLFDRTARKISLTPAGHELFEIVHPWASLGHQVLQDVSNMSTRAASTLRLGVPLGGVNETAAFLLRAAGITAPHANVFLEWGLSRSLVSRLSQGALDFTFAVGPFGDEDLESVEVCDVSLDIIMRSDDSLAGLDFIHPRDLIGRRIAAFPRAMYPSLYEKVFGALQAAGTDVGFYPDLEVVGEQSPDQWPKNYIKIGMSTSLIDSPPNSGACRVPFALGPNFNLRLRLVRPRGGMPGVYRRKLWETANEFFEKSLSKNPASTSNIPTIKTAAQPVR
jgi:DNA-binding transcriptional LysR family regulator